MPTWFSRAVFGRTLVAFVVTTALLGSATPLLAQPAAAPAPAVSAVGTSEDFATVHYGDAWDFADPVDVRLLPDRMNATDLRLEAGELRFSAQGGASLVTLVFPGYGGALYMERDGGAIPINADRYTHVAMRIYSPTDRAMSFSYDRCLAAEHTADFCRASTDNVILKAGWNTVVQDLRALTAARSHTWAGDVYAFRLHNTPADGYRIEYVRLQPAPEQVRVSWDPALGDQLYWDRDTNRGNNTAANSGWGRVTSTGSGQGSFPAGAHEPGSYRFYVVGRGGASAYSDPLEVKARPAPIVLDPDFAGGEDFGVAANGKPWDFSTPADVIASGGFTNASFGPEGLQGTNTNNDPFFYLRMNRPLDANRYHRLTVHATYEGAFNLADIAGGGTHGRLMWTRADRDQSEVILGNKLIESREMVHYPGQSSFTVDLKTPPDPAFLMETDRPEQDGWATGGPVTHLRYDPNEDRGARRWRISRIELRATDETKGGVFDIRWRDVAGTADGTATLAYVPEGGGKETVIVSGLPQQPGDNSYRWDTSSVPPGRYLVRVTVDDGVSEGTNLSTGPVDVRTTIRLSGSNRLETAIALSKTAFPSGAEAAVLARSGGFPDALAAAPLAAAADAPLLLNSTERLEDSVRNELRRLDVDTVYVMGGESAQSSAVTTQLAALGVRVVRLSGPDRFETAAAAAEEAARLWRTDGHSTAGQKVVVALGADFPDALAAGPLTGHGRQPLLLTGRDELPAATRQALEELAAREVTIIGGTSAVSGAVAAQLASGGRTVTRIAGASRHETAELAARAAVDAGARDDIVFVASGRTFADALAAGPAVRQMGGVLLLTEKDVLPAPTRAWVAGRGPLTLLRIAGGTAAVSTPVEQELIATNQG